tara:strand:- start:7421 stop:7756 length:336 start_codon:yes stop_codon:yes gene_type:complete
MKYALITGLFISSIFAEVNTTQIKVDGMQCSYSCAGKVNSIVQKIEGVKESSVDFAKGMATVTYDDKKVNRNDIIKNLKNNTGYSIEQASSATKDYGSCNGSKKKNKNTEI